MTDDVIASVRLTCARCGTVEASIDVVRMVLARPEFDGDRRNLVEFFCPNCGIACSARVDERTTRLIAATGVTVVAAPNHTTERTRSRGAPDAR